MGTSIYRIDGIAEQAVLKILRTDNATDRRTRVKACNDVDRNPSDDRRAKTYRFSLGTVVSSRD